MTETPHERLLLVLEGLVPLRLIQLNRPGELSRAHAEAQDLGDLLTESGDRLTAPGNFRAAADRHARRQALNATATCLALGARQPGGITWAGRHWCTAPHDTCPNRTETGAPMADTSPADHCPFCEIINGRAPATIVKEWAEALALVPLSPVVEGHLLVIPRQHVRDFVENPEVSAATMRCASELVAGMGSYNLITSKGRPATQSVFHLHLHLVPRAENDGLALPWYSGRRRAARASTA